MVKISSKDLLISEAKAIRYTVATLTQLSQRTLPDIHMALIWENYLKACVCDQASVQNDVQSTPNLSHVAMPQHHRQIKGPLFSHLRFNTHPKGRVHVLMSL